MFKNYLFKNYNVVNFEIIMELFYNGVDLKLVNCDFWINFGVY